MDRARVGAWVASLGDHPHAPLLRDILGGYDQAVEAADVLRRELAAANDRAAVADGRRVAAVEDADRLARWIIAHPVGDPSEVLTLHDRTVAG